MKTSIVLPALLATIALGATACGGKNEAANSSAPSPSTASATSAAKAPAKDMTPQPATEPAEPAQAEASATIPDSAAEIWSAIDAKNAQLGAIVSNGDLGQAHPLAYAIRDLVAALPGKSTALPQAEQDQLRQGSSFVATLAKRLDATGDANDRAGAQANYAQLQSVLKGLPRGK